MLGNIRHSLKKIREPWLESARWSRLSYAQEGEDLVLDRLLGQRVSGFYVEIGSHHPFRFSNTYLFYRRGWRGICVDPLPNSKTLFNKWRPRDIALEYGVSQAESVLKYHVFDEPALNTFDPAIAKERDLSSDYNLIKIIDIQTFPLSTVLDGYLPTGQAIDILSVDVEGLDLEVLLSNNWMMYRPKFIIAECLDTELTAIVHDPVAQFLSSVGYRAYAKTGHSVIFTE